MRSKQEREPEGLFGRHLEQDRWKHRLFKTKVQVKEGEDLAPTPWQRYLELGFSPWPVSEILTYMARMGYHWRLSKRDGLFEAISPISLTPGLLASIDYRRRELTAVVKRPPVLEGPQQPSLFGS